MENKGFFRSFIDFSFESYIALKVIKILYTLLFIIYVILLVIGLITGLVLMIMGFKEGAEAVLRGFALIIITPIWFIVYLFFTRIFMEMMAVIFRIAENTAELVRQGRVTRG